MDGKADWPEAYLKDERRAGGVPRRDRATGASQTPASEYRTTQEDSSRAQISLFIRDILFLFYFVFFSNGCLDSFVRIFFNVTGDRIPT